MNQNTIHASDCGCSKCPQRFGTRVQRHRRFVVIMGLYVIGILIGSAALVMGAVAQ